MSAYDDLTAALISKWGGFLPPAAVRLVDNAIREAKAEALRDAADMSRDLANAWGNDAAWMTTGTKVADLWASILTDQAEEKR